MAIVPQAGRLFSPLVYGRGERSSAETFQVVVRIATRHRRSSAAKAG